MADVAVDTDAVRVLPFTLEADKKGMALVLRRVPSVPPGDADAKLVLAELHARHVPVDETIIKAVMVAAASWRANPGVGGKTLLAEGKPPQHGKPGRLVWSEGCDPELQRDGEGGEGFSHYSSQLITVRSGDLIATLEPPTRGTSGADVFGNVLPAIAGKPARAKCKLGCRLDDATGEILSDANGTLEVIGDHIRVNEGLHIHSNVDFQTGNIDSPGDVTVDKDVADCFTLTAGGNVAIRGEVRGAEVRASGSITVRGPVANQRKGVCLAGEDMVVRLVDNSVIACRGSIKDAREVVSSDIFAGESIDSPSGSFCGGVIAARHGVECNVLGSPAETATLALAGVNWLYAALAGPILTEIAEIQAEVDDRTPPLEMLKANMKRLTHEQRETVTEMDFELGERLERRDELQAQIDELRGDSEAAAAATVKVGRCVHPGVEIRLGSRRAQIAKPIRGPVTFMLAQVGKLWTVVAKGATGSPVPLKTGKIDPVADITLPEVPPEARGDDGK